MRAVNCTTFLLAMYLFIIVALAIGVVTANSIRQDLDTDFDEINNLSEDEVEKILVEERVVAISSFRLQQAALDRYYQNSIDNLYNDEVVDMEAAELTDTVDAAITSNIGGVKTFRSRRSPFRGKHGKGDWHYHHHEFSDKLFHKSSSGYHDRDYEPYDSCEFGRGKKHFHKSGVDDCCYRNDDYYDDEYHYDECRPSFSRKKWKRRRRHRGDW